MKTDQEKFEAEWMKPSKVSVDPFAKWRHIENQVRDMLKDVASFHFLRFAPRCAMDGNPVLEVFIDARFPLEMRTLTQLESVPITYEEVETIDA